MPGRMERCPSCGAPKLPAPRCPECQAPYPSLEPRPARAGGAVWTGHEDDARLERQLRLIAPPAVLLLAYLAMHSGLGRFLSRVFLSMWIHEGGHAIAAWLTGTPAIPAPWKTVMIGGRSALIAVVGAAALAAAAYLSWRRTERLRVPLALGAVALLWLALSLGLSDSRADELVLFAGDGGLLVLGPLLMATFFVAPDSHLHKSWLRWGFLFIGAFAFMDGYVTWGDAAADPDTIPFGENEGSGPSDPTRLFDDHAWSIAQLVSRYGRLRHLALAALVTIYLFDLWRQRRAASVARQAQ